ncbi:MAG: hypothetical protein ACE5IL_12055 [Myxococcota bacterium]
MAESTWIHELRFSDEAALSRAFGRVRGSEWVEDCLIEPARLRIRFVAPSDRAAGLVERLYRDRGLVWCERHPLGAQPCERAGGMG